MELDKEVIFEAVKEPLRLLLLSVIPFGLSYLKQLPYEWSGLLLLLLRLLDKYLHELGKATDNEYLTKGLTRF